MLKLSKENQMTELFKEVHTPNLSDFASGIGKALDSIIILNNQDLESMQDWDEQDIELWQDDPYQNNH